jgi:hypothetical protein
MNGWLGSREGIRAVGSDPGVVDILDIQDNMQTLKWTWVLMWQSVTVLQDIQRSADSIKNIIA